MAGPQVRFSGVPVLLHSHWHVLRLGAQSHGRNLSGHDSLEPGRNSSLWRLVPQCW